MIKKMFGIEYENDDDYEYMFFKPIDIDPTKPLVCCCGSTTFEIYFPQCYTTNAKCTSCGREETIHSG